VAKTGDRGVYASLNQSSKPFIWNATVEDIIKKLDRARVKIGADQT
jgi:hypothetical protein